MINKYIESVINFIKNKLDKNIIEAKDIDKALIKQFVDKTNLISIEECVIIEIIGNKPLILNCIEVSIIIKHKDIMFFSYQRLTEMNIFS